MFGIPDQVVILLNILFVLFGSALIIFLIWNILGIYSTEKEIREMEQESERDHR